MPKYFLICVITSYKSVKTLRNRQDIYQALINLLQYALEGNAQKLNLPADRKGIALLLQD